MPRGKGFPKFSSKHTLMLSSEIKSPEAFFQAIFWKSSSDAYTALEIFNIIKANEEKIGGLPGKEWKHICESLRIKPTKFYSILRTLESCGIVRREPELRVWKISGKFLSFVEPLIVVYEEMSKYKSVLRR